MTLIQYFQKTVIFRILFPYFLCQVTLERHGRRRPGEDVVAPPLGDGLVAPTWDQWNSFLEKLLFLMDVFRLWNWIQQKTIYERGAMDCQYDRIS